MKRGKKILLYAYRAILVLGIFCSLGWGIVHRETAVAGSPAPTAASRGPIEVFFSLPPAFHGDLTGGPDEDLVAAIDAARCCVDLAVYDVDLISVADALLRAGKRGAAVRIVTDDDNLGTGAIGLLRARGIPVVDDGRSALMHDKFVLIDRREVWTGSMNLTENCAYRNDNNFLRIESIPLAEIFGREFEEMFTERKFGSNSPDGVPAPPVAVGTVAVEALFAPEDRVLDRLVREIDSAEASIHFLAFSFTSDAIGARLRARADDGVAVQGVFEATQVKSSADSEFYPLQAAGLDVRLDGNPRNMHDKVMILDGGTIVTGSYNFTASADSRNDEVLLIIRDPRLAGEFEREFRRIFAMASTG
jgi:phosphatidylserine/phosphatidylglycerophosphate/cardiolipin synthase-like enzyme